MKTDKISKTQKCIMKTDKISKTFKQLYSCKYIANVYFSDEIAQYEIINILNTLFICPFYYKMHPVIYF
jgi:hypothetical protein